MDSDELTQCTQNTQGFMDPRRMGRNNSGLSAEDCADVMCILHPGSPAAFQLVAETASRSPQHILQDVKGLKENFHDSPSLAEEQETFILDDSGSNVALDLAFRFSSETLKPHLGFTFGRNKMLCDIAPATDVHKRVSNLHFIVYMNESGVLMLQDMSTNGTMVDDHLLKGRGNQSPRTRMLNHGSILQILSPNPAESLKFIIRIPSRTGYHDQYEHNFRVWMDKKMDAEVRNREEDDDGVQVGAKPVREDRQPNPAVKAPIIQNQFGMHWNGGEKYNVVGQIGKGAFASVYQLATKDDGHLFAAKELEKRKFMKNGVLDRKLENEMHIMQSIDHTSIVQYHEYQDAANHLYIIMEFVHCGDLQQYLHEFGPLPEPVAKQMATQVFDALDYLHKKRITHRDIKPDNILIASMDEDNFIIKLSDFGLSKVVKDNDTFLKTFCGTLLYCAPEVFPHYDAHMTGKGTKRPRKPPPPQPPNKFHSYSQAVDIWSFGAVLWYSLCLKPPFEGVADNTGRGMFDKIMMTALDEGDLTKQGVSKEAVALLLEMLNTDPAARPSAESCMGHAWFGNQPLPARRQPDSCLGAIAEEMEADQEGAGEPDVGSLSLDERQPPTSQYSEISLNSEDLDFFDPRKSKRFKTDEGEANDEDEDNGDLIDSSPELFESIPIMHDDQQQHEKNAVKPKPPKLFGEISQSDLQSPAFNRRVENVVEDEINSNEFQRESVTGYNQQNAQGKSQRQPGSLQGAEQLVRDMNMDPPYALHGENGPEKGSRTPPSFDGLSEMNPSQESARYETPPTEEPPQPVRAAQSGHAVPFKRKINIPLPPSFYYEPNDPSTHNIEYASKVSGRDYVNDPAYKMKYSAKDPSLPATSANSQQSGSDVGSVNEPTATVPGACLTAQEALSRAVYGRLISTPESAECHLALEDQITTFGRSQRSTYIWPDATDTRIGKDALSILFGNGKISKDQDISSLSGLYCNILTHGSNGLQINGVHLPKYTPEKHVYGRLFTGDEIEVCSPSRTKPGLKFIVQINVGESKVRRPKYGPMCEFKVMCDSSPSSKKAETDAEPTTAGAADVV